MTTHVFTRWNRSEAAHPYAILGSAEELAAMAQGHQFHHSWHFYGSPEADYFLAARPDASMNSLRQLALDGRLALPSTAEWLPLSLDELEEFSP